MLRAFIQITRHPFNKNTAYINVFLIVQYLPVSKVEKSHTQLKPLRLKKITPVEVHTTLLLIDYRRVVPRLKLDNFGEREGGHGHHNDHGSCEADACANLRLTVDVDLRRLDGKGII